MPIDDDEAFLAKLARKSKSDPFVPIGCMATLAMLTGGLYSFKLGQAATSQQFMRARVVAQAATVAVVGVGTFLLGTQVPSSHLRPDNHHELKTQAQMSESTRKLLNDAAETAAKKKEETAADMAASLIPSPSTKQVSLNTASMLAAVATQREENASRSANS